MEIRANAIRMMAIALFGLLIAYPAQGGGESLTIAHTAKAGSLVDATVDAFVTAANKALNGKATVKKISAGGDQKALLKKVKKGTITFTVTSADASKNFHAGYGLFEMPFVIADRDNLKRLLDKKKGIIKKISKRAKKKKFALLGVWENGFRHIANNDRAVKKPADLKGVAIASTGWRKVAFETYGAKAAAGGGREATLPEIASGKAPKFVSLSGHAYIPAFLVAGRKPWKGVSEEIQKAIKSAAKRAQKFAYAEGAKRDAAAIKKLRAAGAKVNEVDRAAFIAASDLVYDKFVTRVNGAYGLLNHTRKVGTASGS